jgi:hypothetical protein
VNPPAMYYRPTVTKSETHELISQCTTRSEHAAKWIYNQRRLGSGVLEHGTICSFYFEIYLTHILNFKKLPFSKKKNFKKLK